MKQAGPKKLLKKTEVVELLGISSTTIYRLIKAGKFPKPIKLSPSRIAWTEAAIQKWLKSKK